MIGLRGLIVIAIAVVLVGILVTWLLMSKTDITDTQLALILGFFSSMTTGLLGMLAGANLSEPKTPARRKRRRRT